MHFRGMYAPLTTPFDHTGAVYWAKFDYNLSQLQRTRLAGFLVGDRWGEGPLLSAREKAQLWARAATQAGEGPSVLAAIEGCGVAEAREQVETAAEAGCSAAVLMAPDLRALSSRDGTAALFYRAVADAARLPVLAAIDQTGPRSLPLPELAALAAHPRIAGALLSGSDAAYVRKAAAACGRGFALIVRDFESTAASLADGAVAALLAVAAAVPFFALSIEEAVRTRELEAARDLVERGTAFDRLLREHGVPALKRALDLRSGYGGPPRLPLLPAPPPTAAAVEASLRDLAS